MEAETAPKSVPNQVMDVVAPPAANAADQSPEDTNATHRESVETALKDAAKPTAAQPKTPKDKGVMVAITMTVIIVSGLSVLAVMAYLSAK